MSEAIIVALISGGLALLGTIITVLVANAKQTEHMKTSQAVLDVKIEEMKKDIKSHNQYAKLFNENIPVIHERIRVLDNRVTRLENED